MRKTFSWFMALFTGIVLLVTGCSNASQITFGDPSKDNFTNDGLAKITVDADFGSTSGRTIFPQDFSDAEKANLFYVLTGDDNDGMQTDLINKGKGVVFTYDQIESDKAIVNLEPKRWHLKLTAYQPAGGDKVDTFDIEAPGSSDKAVLSFIQDADLSTGSQTVTFDLEKVASTKATGKVDLHVNFYDEGIIQKAKFEILKDGNGDDFVDGSVATGANITNGKSDIVESVGFAPIVKIGEEGYSSILLTGDVPAGNHMLKVTFYTLKDSGSPTTSADYIPCFTAYKENILIIGGSTSKAVIDIPKGSMSKAPAGAINLESSVSFEPDTVTDHNEATFVTLVDGTKAQKLPANPSADQAPVALEDHYQLKFTWTDKSYNETNFKLVLSKTDDGSDADAVVITPDSSPNTIKITVNGGSYSGADGKITLIDGNLDAGQDDRSITLSVPTNMSFKSAKLFAENEMTETGKLKANGILLKKDIGMITVAYGLQSAAPSKVAKIQYNGSTATDGTDDKYFVMGYDISKKTNLIGTDLYPTVKLDSGEIFAGWKASATDTYSADGAVTGGVLETAGTSDVSLTAADITANIVVYPTWTVKTTVAVNFPSYTDYRNIKVTTSSDPVVHTWNDPSHTFTIEAFKPVSTATTKDYSFTVTKTGVSGNIFATSSPTDPADPSATSTPTGITQGLNGDSNILTWDETNFAGGDYQVFISYKYDPDGLDPKPEEVISGTIYVKIIR